MIVWDVVDGDLFVWMFDSDPQTDPPDQQIPGPHEWDDDQIGPSEIKSDACFNELASVWPNLTNREIRIGLEAALERIERR